MVFAAVVAFGYNGSMIDPTDVEELIAQATQDRKRAYEAADAEYNAAVEAIRKVQVLLKRRLAPSNGSLIEPSTDGKRSSAAWPGLRRAIRDAIEQSPFGFALDDIMSYMQDVYAGVQVKRVAVSGELWRMNRKGEIGITERGSGNKPNIYAKAEAIATLPSPEAAARN